jgi:hypothetical protein
MDASIGGRQGHGARVLVGGVAAGIEGRQRNWEWHAGGDAGSCIDRDGLGLAYAHERDGFKVLIVRTVVRLEINIRF